MAKFQFTGQAPVRYGSGLVKPGDILELPAAPNKNWKPVRDVKQRAAKADEKANKSEEEKSDDKS